MILPLFLNHEILSFMNPTWVLPTGWSSSSSTVPAGSFPGDVLLQDQTEGTQLLPENLLLSMGCGSWQELAPWLGSPWTAASLMAHPPAPGWDPPQAALTWSFTDCRGQPASLWSSPSAALVTGRSDRRGTPDVFSQKPPLQPPPSPLLPNLAT